MKYPKINSLYKRYTSGSFRNQLIDGRDSAFPEFSTDEFELLYATQFPWTGTEKIDGTNIRLNFLNSGEDYIYGRSDNAQIPSFLLIKLMEIRTRMRVEIPKIFDDFVELIFFGEGYGAKIQKGGENYISDGVDFILFDINIDGIWLRRDSIEDIAKKLDLDVVPVVFEGSLKFAEERVKAGFDSVVSQNTQKAEGMVLTPVTGFLDRIGNRIITKIKTKDY